MEWVKWVNGGVDGGWWVGEEEDHHSLVGC